MQFAGSLHLTKMGPAQVTVEFEASLAAYRAVTAPTVSASGPLPRRDVVRFDSARKEIEITPILIYPPKSRFLKPRFDQIRTILFEGHDVWLPASPPEVEAALDVIPQEFYRRAEFGLGLPRVLMPFIREIERIPTVTRLIVSRTRPAAINGTDVILTHDQVEDALTFLQRVYDRHQRRSLEERRAHIRNHLVSPLDAARFPEEVPPYTADTVFEALNVVRNSKLKLSGPDKDAMVTEVGKRITDLQREAPEKLFQLHRDIELLNLDTLIDRFKALAAVDQIAEKRWQKLFDLNPFILSMVFGYPVVKVLREASIGLPLLDGSGAKIGDFLAKNPATSNAALVELKTPQADLLSAKPYRGKTTSNPVYQPHPELTGAVAQVLDQRYRLQKDIATHLSNNRGLDLAAYHVDCVVVAGRTPADEERRQAFELYRQSLKDVRIVTFDELLIKLETLRAFLAEHPRPSDEEIVEPSTGGAASSDDDWIEDDDLADADGKDDYSV